MNRGNVLRSQPSRNPPIWKPKGMNRGNVLRSQPLKKPFWTRKVIIIFAVGTLCVAGLIIGLVLGLKKKKGGPSSGPSGGGGGGSGGGGSGGGGSGGGGSGDGGGGGGGGGRPSPCPSGSPGCPAPSQYIALVSRRDRYGFLYNKKANEGPDPDPSVGKPAVNKNITFPSNDVVLQSVKNHQKALGVSTGEKLINVNSVTINSTNPITYTLLGTNLKKTSLFGCVNGTCTLKQMRTIPKNTLGALGPNPLQPGQYVWVQGTLADLENNCQPRGDASGWAGNPTWVQTCVSTDASICKKIKPGSASCTWGTQPFWTLNVGPIPVAATNTLDVQPGSVGHNRKSFNQKTIRTGLDYGAINPNKKRILYLVQVETNIPNTYNWLRNRDKLILSYKKHTDDTDIFFPNSTWTTGRNKLFELARKKDYDYYVFLDFDLDLTLDKINKFENIINRFKENYPIIVPEMWGYNSITTHQDIKYNRKALYNKLFECQTVDHFDGAFNAFHKDSINKLLPYTSTYDNESWHYSQLLLILKSNFLFKNKIVQINTIHLTNTSHSSYPTNMTNIKSIVDKYIKDNLMESLLMSNAIEIRT